METATKVLMQQIAATRWQRTLADGSVLVWEQEDESAVTDRESCVAMIQRALNFWVPFLASQFEQKGMPRAEARFEARAQFTQTLNEMIDQPFTKRWGVTLSDFNWSFE